MRLLRLLSLLALVLSLTEGFTTKKKERRPIFQSTAFTKESSLDQQVHEEQAHVSSTHSGSMPFAFGTTPVQVVQYYEPEEDFDVSYSVALVSCMLSLALGFGLGYGT